MGPNPSKHSAKKSRSTRSARTGGHTLADVQGQLLESATAAAQFLFHSTASPAASRWLARPAMSQNITVAVRVRPLSQKEVDRGAFACLEVADGEEINCIDPDDKQLESLGGAKVTD